MAIAYECIAKIKNSNKIFNDAVSNYVKSIRILYELKEDMSNVLISLFNIYYVNK